MSKTVDNRVVELGIENREFEGGVKTSLGSIESLKKALNFDESARSLTSLTSLARTFTLAGMAENLENISGRFSTLGAIGFSVINNLTNSFVNLGKQMLTSLALDPLRTGLEEYETQINAVQTIMANTSSKGTTLTQVNSALDELNSYADKTIYNFTEMTRNIGTFTAAGVDLDKSVSAIKGIANLAAVSGSNAQQASTAMYQLSQALSSGTLKLQDWNSVVNAGMGGQVFQDALKETARVHGVSIDAMIKKEGSFRETLAKGWLTSDILTETLNKFTGDMNESQLKSLGYTEQQITEIVKLGKMANDAATKVKTFSQLKDTLQEAIQSGWSQSWRIVMGDFEEAKSFFTDVSNTLGALIGESSDARNNLLQGWKDLGGRAMLVESVQNIFEGLLRIMKPIKEAFSEIFPPITAQHLFNLTKALRDLTAYLKIGDDTASKIKRTFKGVASVVNIVFQAVGALLGGFASLFSGIAPVNFSFIDLLANIGDYLVGINDAIKNGDLFKKGLESIATFISTVASKVEMFVKILAGLFTGKISLNDLFGKIDFSGLLSGASGMLSGIPTLISNLFKNIDLSGIMRSAGGILANITSFFSNLFKNIDLGSALNFIKNTTVSLDPLGKLGNLLTNLFSGLQSIIAKIMPKLGEFGEKAKSAFGTVGEKVSGIFKGIDFGKLFNGFLDALKKISWTDIINTIQGGLFGALILAIRKFILSGSDAFGEIGGMFTGITETLGSVRESLESWQKSLKVDMLFKIAAALGIMAASIVALSLIDSGKLAVSLTAVTVMLKELMGVMSSLDKSSKTSGASSLAISLIGVSVALLIMSAALGAISTIDTKSLGTGLVGISVLMGLLIAFSKAVSKNSGTVVKGAMQIILFAVALEILTDVVRRLGSIDVKSLKQGLVGIGALLTELAIFMKVTNLDGMGFSTGLGLVAMAASLLIMAVAVEKFASFDANTILMGLTTIGLILAELAIFINLTGNGTGVLAASVGLVILAGALLILTQVLVQLGNLPWEVIGKGLLTLAGIFGVLGLGGLLLAPLVPVLLGLAAGVFLFGIASLAAGVGLLAFSLGLAGLAVSGVAAAGAVIVILKMFSANMPVFVQVLQETLFSMIKVIAALTPPLLDAIQVLLLKFIDVIIAIAPRLIEAAIFIIDTFLNTLAAHMPSIVESGMKMILALLQGIEKNIGEIVKAGINIILKLLDGISQKIPDIVDAGWDVAIRFIDGLASGIDNNAPAMQAALGRLANSIVTMLVNSLLAGIGAVGAAIASLAAAIIDAITGAMGTKSDTNDAGQAAAQGYAAGLDSGEATVTQSAEALRNRAVDILSGAISSTMAYINGDMEVLQPTIKPVIDLTGVVEGTKEIGNLLQNQTLDLASSSIKLASLANSSSPTNNTVNPTTPVTQPATQVTFTQTINSPTPLSPVEIYRQTRNQLSTIKDLVRNP